MKYESDLSIADRDTDRDKRSRMRLLRVLVADRDLRTAKLVKRILFSFGIRNISLTTSGEETLGYLRAEPFDFLITEWDMHPLDGITLVKEIRAAKKDKRIRRDIPIIMLTGRTEIGHIQAARDAGITEFIAKPFTAKAISNRIIRIIDNPRSFVDSVSYVGPCRRRRGDPPPGVADRRIRADQDKHVTPPDFSLRETLGVDSATEIINDMVVKEAQLELMQAAGEFINWAESEILQLRKSYNALSRAPGNQIAQRALVDAAYAIKSQAGIFGYNLGTEVANLLVNYAERHMPPKPNHLVVIGKHIDVIGVVFHVKAEEQGEAIALDLIQSLRKLVDKME